MNFVSFGIRAVHAFRITIDRPSIDSFDILSTAVSCMAMSHDSTDNAHFTTIRSASRPHDSTVTPFNRASA